jgi:hypothetical protein
MELAMVQRGHKWEFVVIFKPVRPSERRDLLNEYLKDGDENLFHDMIENGGEMVEELSAGSKGSGVKTQSSQ